jgi:hypothetical protein
MNSAGILKSIIDVMRGDSVISSHVSDRIYMGNIIPKVESAMPMISVYMEDDSTIGGLPASNYAIIIPIWYRIIDRNPQQKLLDIKDGVKALLNQHPDTINVQSETNGYGNKVRSFDFVSAVEDTSFVGTLKLLQLPCIFESIIED